MNAQRMSGRRPAAWVTAATLAVAVSVVPVHPALAVPMSHDEPAAFSMSALWQRVSGWMGLESIGERPPATARATGAGKATSPEPASSSQLDESSAVHRTSNGDDGVKFDPVG